MARITSQTVKDIIKLCEKFTKLPHLTAQEFINEVLLEKEANEKVAKMFLVLKKHERIFDCAFEHYTKENKICEEDYELGKMLIYLVVFELTDLTYESIRNVFFKLKMSLSISLLQFFNREEFIILLTEASCTLFDNDYVLCSIITPFLGRVYLLENLQHEVIEHFAEKNKVVPKPTTKPIGPTFSNTKREKEVGTPVVMVKPERKFTPVPTTTYQPDRTKERIEIAKGFNRKHALELLEKANLEAFRVSRVVKAVVPTKNLPRLTIKPTKIPKFRKDVEVKKNAAMLMREAALFVKSQEKEIKKLEDLTSGAFDDGLIEEWEEEERTRMQKENIQNIEKKHLQGMLTYEEALLAKQNLIKANKIKFLEFQTERNLLYEKLEEWKKEEQEKINNLVEKAQNIERAAKEAERKSFEEKYNHARQQDFETKTLLTEAMAQQQAELNRKIELIKELKALQSVKEFYHKEFDPTESPNLGLMCEMSIAELQERLGLLRLELKEELKAKQKTIMEARQQRKELLESAQEFIQENRNRKKSGKKKTVVKLEETEEILALKEKISEVRRLRMKDF